MKNNYCEQLALKVLVAILLYISFTNHSNAQMVAESFESQSFPPQGWSKGPVGWDDKWGLYTGNSSHGNLSAGVNVAGNSPSWGSYLRTPAVALQAGQQIQLSFDYSVTNTDGEPAFMRIFASESGDGTVYGSHFDEIVFTAITPYTTYFTTFTPSTAGNYYFYIDLNTTFYHPFAINIDNFFIQQGSECGSASNLSVSNVTSTSATVSWDAVQGVSSWQIQHTAGTMPVEANWVDVNASQTTISNLVPGTNYAVYLRSDCGENNYGYIGVPVSFLTPCQEIMDAPYTMSFFGNTLPNCWTQTGDTEWDFNLSADYGAKNAGDHTLLQGVSNYAWVDGTHNTHGKKAMLLSPLMDVSSLDAPALEFYVYSSNKLDNTSNELLVEIFDGSAWLPVYVLDTSSDEWKFVSIDLDPEILITQARFTVTGKGDLTYYNDILLDDISFKEKTTCFPGYAVTGTVTTSTISLTWDSDNNDALWDIAYISANDIFTGTPDFEGVSSPFTINNLEGSTNYYIYLRANCNEGASLWAGPFIITTDCVSYDVPYLYGFQTNTLPPYSFNFPGLLDCWGIASGGDFQSGPLQYGESNWKANFEGQYGAITNSESATIAFFGSDMTSWLLSPVFDLPADYEAKIRIALTASLYSTLMVNMGGDDEVRFGYSYDGISWETLKVFSANDNLSTGYHTVIVPLIGITGEVRFAFWANEGVNDNVIYQFHVDNFELREKSICPEALNLLADGVTDQTAVLSWDGPVQATSWEVAVVSAGAAPTVADWSTVDTNPFVWTGLSANTAYEFYVKSICATTASEIVSEPYSFTTKCAPITAPYTETFVEYGMVPSCWTENPLARDEQLFMVYFWNYTTGATADAAQAGDHTPGGGTHYAWLNTANFLNQQKAVLTTALVDISTLENPALQFYLFSENSIDNALNHVSVKVFKETAWEELTKITSYTNGWAEHTIDLSGLDSPVQVQFEVLINENGGYAGYNQILIDDVSFMEMPSCPAPFNLEVSEVTESGATISWESAAVANGWEVIYGAVGFSPDEAIGTEGVTAPEIILSGLEQGVSYQVYVVPLCGDDQIVGPVSFTVETVAGGDNPEIDGLAYYPNPADDILYLKANEMVDVIEVYDVLGQKVKQLNPRTTSMSLDITSLSSGMYMVKAYSGANVSVFRIVKK